MRVFTCQQCEYSSSGSDVSVNAVIIPQNWGAIPSTNNVNTVVASLRRSASIAPQFRGMMTVLTDTSSPELQYSLITHLYKSEEGSKAERFSVYNTIRNVDRYLKYT